MFADSQPDTTQPSAASSLSMYSGADAGVRPDDNHLTINVRLVLMYISSTLADSVTIDTRDGVVHLRGSVRSERELVCMYKAARMVDGIRWICNDVVVVRPTDRVQDDLASIVKWAPAG